VTEKDCDQRPLFVDLDGTLTLTDTLWESLAMLIKAKPLMLLLIPFALLRGKAWFKRYISGHVELDPQALPYRTEVLSFINAEYGKGRRIILATAADSRIANAVSAYLGIFSCVMASDGTTNLSGKNKLEAIRAYAGEGGFDYIGNDSKDLPVWEKADTSHIVAASDVLVKNLERISTVGQIFSGQIATVGDIARTLRPYQWVKNSLLFVPFLLAHRFGDASAIMQAFSAFVAFSLCASSVYVVNDILDMAADRQHPWKNKRPFARGILSPSAGILIALLCLSASVVLAFLTLPLIFIAMLLLYFALANAYSLYVKRLLALDVLLLAGLYTHRLLSGAEATGDIVSAWLMGFSIFFFLNLAFIKRYTELRGILNGKENFAGGRGYRADDISIVKTAGIASGYISVLVLALYINGNDVSSLYSHPWVLWLLGPCFLYWITRIWLIAGRGQMHDDPIIFTFKDRASYVVGAIVMAIIMGSI
jgi:4-hydroxybenzoate polyprenyltransferase